MTDVINRTNQKKPDPCSFVIFGATGDLTHRLVIPALYNLAATDCCRTNSAWSASPARACPSDDLRDSLMKGLRQFATRPVDEAIAKRLLECVTCIEADPKEPASFDAMREQLEKLEASARRPAATGCSIWRRRRTPSLPISRELGRTGMLKETTAPGGGWWWKSRSAPIWPRPRRSTTNC